MGDKFDHTSMLFCRGDGVTVVAAMASRGLLGALGAYLAWQSSAERYFWSRPGDVFLFTSVSIC